MNAEKTSCRFTSPVYRLLLFCSVAALILALMPASGHAQGKGSGNPICNQVGKSIQVSSGGQMWCFGAQPNGASARKQILANGSTGTPPNVNAAQLSEDVNPAGVRAFGQSEVSVASSGPYVVEAWNDATGFFSPCPSPMNKEELTGFGFSNNGGATFTDEGGVPNTANCASNLVSGDPAVAVYTPPGATYFYIASLYPPGFFAANQQGQISLTPCVVNGSGSSATLACNAAPTIAAVSDFCFFGFCSFLDKDFITVDEASGRLYITYSEFGGATGEEENLAACDLTPNPLAPVCSNGANSIFFNTGFPPYLTVSPGQFCEQEGSYPAFSPGTGDLYVAFENNWGTALFGFCATVPVNEQVNRIAASCLTDPALGPSSCSGPTNSTNVFITSIQAAFIPGYNRFPPNDFPRIAVSDPFGTVSIVWNDTRNVPLGQIFLQSLFQGTLAPVQGTPTILNTGYTAAMHYMPGLRNSSSSGLLNVSWLDRRLHPTTAKTDTFAALNVSPLATSVSSNKRISNISGDWNAASSDIIPNFGDYTDSFVSASNVFQIAWADARLQDPQPFYAHVAVH